jgi:hypothetical protein
MRFRRIIFDPVRMVAEATNCRNGWYGLKLCRAGQIVEGVLPIKGGAFSAKESAFIKRAAATGDHVYAAKEAGYAVPRVAAWKLMDHPIVAEATREGARAFLRDKAGGIGVAVLASIALDEKQPASARTTAATNLAKLSGIAITDGEAGKDLHEMDGAELAKYAAKLRAQASAAEGRLADQAKPIIEGETVDSSPVTPSPFD